MSLEVCVLASGSGGNCTALRTPAGMVLIDAGIGPRLTARRLNGTGALLREISAICLTHLDRDHFSPTWADALLSQGIRLFCHVSKVAQVLRIAGESASDSVVPFHDAFEPLAGLRMHPIHLEHDLEGSHGFVAEGFGCRVGYATDLGRVPRELIDGFAGLDVLAIESNYDPMMQQDSGRPWFLKHRIMGGRGHLSNEQAFDAVREILNRCERTGARLPAHIVLLHRSRQCNCPHRVRQVFARDSRIPSRLTLAEQFQRTDWLRVRPASPLTGEQLILAWG